jgi:MFS family permease
VLPWRSAFVAVTLIGAALVGVMLWVVLRGPGWEPVVVARPSFRSMLHLPALLVMLGYCAHSWQLFTVWGWLAPFLADALATRPDLAPAAVVLAGTLSAVLLGLGAGGVYVGGLLSDRLGRTVTAGSILGMSALLSFTFGWLRAAPLPLLLAAGLVYGLLVSASSAVYSASLSEIVDPGRLGASLALQATAGYLAGVVGPIVFGGILDGIGKPVGWGVAFASAGVAALIGASGMLRLRRLPAASRLAGGLR